ncbi:hypothetical protein C8J57DRAFT_1250504 [Mycena rebaudengoi]|nr:hypothetical protein C8J57DRAFT_1250504 [Mycena rebaudengoi]
MYCSHLKEECNWKSVKKLKEISETMGIRIPQVVQKAGRRLLPLDGSEMYRQRFQEGDIPGFNEDAKERAPNASESPRAAPKTDLSRVKDYRARARKHFSALAASAPPTADGIESAAVKDERATLGNVGKVKRDRSAHAGRSQTKRKREQTISAWWKLTKSKLLLQSRLKRARPDNPTPAIIDAALPAYRPRRRRDKAFAYAILDRRNLLHPPSAGEDAVTNNSGSPSCLPTLLPPSASASTTSPPPPLASLPLVKYHRDVEDAGGAWRLGKHGVGALFAVNSWLPLMGKRTTRRSGPTTLRDVLRGRNGGSDAGRANIAKSRWGGCLHIVLGGFGPDCLSRRRLLRYRGRMTIASSPGPIPADLLRTPPSIGREARRRHHDNARIARFIPHPRGIPQLLPSIPLVPAPSGVSYPRVWR